MKWYETFFIYVLSCFSAIAVFHWLLDVLHYPFWFAIAVDFFVAFTWGVMNSKASWPDTETETCYKR